MKKVGIICDLNYSRHPLFKNYYYAIEYLYGATRLVTTINDLYDLDILFIGDDHWITHKLIWQDEDFIKRCNVLNIKVVVFTTEKILNSNFPWNVQINESLMLFNKLYHYTIDVDDCIALKTKLNRVLISRHYKNYFPPQEEKLDKIVFIGRTDCTWGSYSNRSETLRELAEVISIDILPSTIETWEEYMQTIARYRFVLSPIGNANTFPLRFYETLLVRSIPLHQITENTLQYYDIEAGFDDCIYFKDPGELPEKIKNCTITHSYNELWLEDYIKNLLKGDELL